MDVQKKEIPQRPIDLLPIKYPLNNPVPEIEFYEKVVKPLTKDFLKIMHNGIAINMQKVYELEEVLEETLTEVKDTLKNNPLIQKTLEFRHEESKKATLQKFTAESKDLKSFIKPCDYKNKIHRTYVINYYLRACDKGDMQLPEWTTKEAKRLCQVITSPFLESFLDGTMQTSPYIDGAMEELARDKFEIYLKTRTQKKLETIEKNKVVDFNPGSDNQKRNFFSRCGFEPYSLTEGGQDQWNRDNLETLLQDIKDEEKFRKGEGDVPF